MSKILIHPELIELFGALRVADIDYEENRGSPDVGEYAERARGAQMAFRERKAELEAAGVEIWGAEMPKGQP